MDSKSIKELMYGGIKELMRNKNYYYNSSVGSSYSHWTEEGHKAVVEYMDLLAGKIKEAEEAELDARAKQMVMTGLQS